MFRRVKRIRRRSRIVDAGLEVERPRIVVRQPATSVRRATVGRAEAELSRAGGLRAADHSRRAGPARKSACWRRRTGSVVRAGSADGSAGNTCREAVYAERSREHPRGSEGRLPSVEEGRATVKVQDACTASEKTAARRPPQRRAGRHWGDRVTSARNTSSNEARRPYLAGITRYTPIEEPP